MRPPFIVHTLASSVRALHAASLVLVVQTRQADRARLHALHGARDRVELEESLAERGA